MSKIPRLLLIKLKERIQYCSEKKSEFNKWEKEFIDSIQLYIAENNSITWKQEKILLGIWNKVKNG